MRCPKCRKEIAFEAVRHEACGWRASSVVAAEAEAKRVEVERVTEEQRGVHMAKIRKILGAAPARLSREERLEGAKLSPEEERFRREMNDRRRARLERLRKTVEQAR